MYLKKNTVAEGQFKSKIDLAIEQIKSFPHIDHRKGVVTTDSWYSSKDLINTTIDEGFEGIFALKSNRKIIYKEKSFKVDELAESLDSTAFSFVTVEGKRYRYFRAKVQIEELKREKVQLFICQLELKSSKEEQQWTDFYYLLVTDLQMRAWTVIYLYRKRWAIETFYKFSKECLAFKHSRLESAQAISRFLILIFLVYTFLVLMTYQYVAYYVALISKYQAQDHLQACYKEKQLETIIEKVSDGWNKVQICLYLGFRKKSA